MALPPQPNPILAVTLPIVLDREPGTHAPTEALRLALLGVAAVHIAYLRSRAALGQGTDVMAPSLEPTLSPLSSTMMSLGLPAAPQAGAITTSATLGVTEDGRQLLAFSAMMRLQATRCLALACREGFGGAGTTEEGDAALGATMAVVLIDIFSGGHQWMKNIGLAKALIQSRGGPNAILQQSTMDGFAGRGGSNTRRRFGGGVKVSAARFWLEMLAVYETFGSLTSGEEPTLLAPGFTDWWTLDGSAGDLGYHKTSIEKVFGLARSMVVLIAKVSSFLCRTIRERAIITEAEPGGDEHSQTNEYAPMEVDVVPNILGFDTGLAIPQTTALEPSTAFQPVASTSASMAIPLTPTGTQDGFDFDQWLNDLGPMAQIPASLTPILGSAMPNSTTTGGFLAAIPDELYMQERVRQLQAQEDRARVDELRQFFFDAKQLYREVENWQDEVPIMEREARVIAGNRTHQLAMQILILREIFHVPRTDERVQRAASGILALCLECAEQDMGIDLTWPVIIAGTQVYAALERQQVQLAFDCFKKQCCFEIESSQRIVTEVWRRMDEEAEAARQGTESVWKGRDDWRAVVEDLNLRILVL